MVYNSVINFNKNICHLKLQKKKEERDEQRKEKIRETGQQLNQVVSNMSVYDLEKSIRWMSLDEREKLYKAIEISKTATDSLLE